MCVHVTIAGSHQTRLQHTQRRLAVHQCELKLAVHESGPRNNPLLARSLTSHSLPAHHEAAPEAAPELAPELAQPLQLIQVAVHTQATDGFALS